MDLTVYLFLIMIIMHDEDQLLKSMKYNTATLGSYPVSGLQLQRTNSWLETVIVISARLTEASKDVS